MVSTKAFSGNISPSVLIFASNCAILLAVKSCKRGGSRGRDSEEDISTFYGQKRSYNTQKIVIKVSELVFLTINACGHDVNVPEKQAFG